MPPRPPGPWSHRQSRSAPDAPSRTRPSTRRARGALSAAVQMRELNKPGPPGHFRDRVLDGAVRNPLGAAPRPGALPFPLAGGRGETGTPGVGVERVVLLGPKNPGEEIGHKLAAHYRGVGPRERPAATVARRS